MDKKSLYFELLNIVGLDNLKCNEEMKNHTTLSVGGNVKFLIEPTTESEIKRVVDLLNEYNQKYYVIGRGSNLLVKDGDIDLAIIKISDKFAGIEVSKNSLKVLSGTSLAEVSKVSYKNGLSGIEFASGIPGTIGGAIAMNAGAYGGEIKDVVSSVKVIDEFGNIKVMSKEDMKFSYRRSILTENPKIVVLSVEISLEFGNKEDIFNEMYSRSQKRVLSQPLEKCNCGSTFKRPAGHFAGKLIEDCGLKGYSLNGVEVSEKHAGFVVNNGKSTATDMINMINYIKEEVNNKFGVLLEEEVRIIG